MKKMLLMLACLMLFAGCASAASEEEWPKKVEGKGIVITKMDEVPPRTYARTISYMLVTTEEVMRDTDLIIAVTIPEPVIYEFDYGNSINDYLYGYKVEVEKVYYTDAGIKVGDTVKFFRAIQVDQIWQTLQPGCSYTLFLERKHKEEYAYNATILKVAEYVCKGPNSTFMPYNAVTDVEVEDLVKQYK